MESAAGGYGTVTLPLAGEHQVENLATALVCAEQVAECVGLELTPALVRAGLKRVTWPGRLQLLQETPPVLLDGAHNPQAAAALAAFLGKAREGRPLGLILGVCADKDVEHVIAPLAPLVSRAWTVPTPSERSWPPIRQPPYREYIAVGSETSRPSHESPTPRLRRPASESTR